MTLTDVFLRSFNESKCNSITQLARLPMLRYLGTRRKLERLLKALRASRFLRLS
jgi:hypothetical protein